MKTAGQSGKFVVKSKNLIKENTGLRPMSRTEHSGSNFVWQLVKKPVTKEGSLVQRELSAKLTEGLFYEMSQLLGSILKVLDFSFTTPPAKIGDFCHLPLHRGGFGWS